MKYIDFGYFFKGNNFIFRVFITSIFLILLNNSSFAEHIIGADLNYECLGEGSTVESRMYKVYYKQYLDCTSLDLGNDLYFGVWNSGNFEVLTMVPDSIFELENPNYPCLELPQGICIQERIYSGEIELTLSDSAYYIVYQKCCRTEEITNINSNLALGSTHYIEINSESQLVCNNSPIFQFVPPTFMCVDQFLELSQEAIDIDGDQLVYELCSPLGENGISPSTGSPPPYSSVPFIMPTYNELHPLGTNILSLNPTTGLLSGNPPTLGQFLVGICISEYRNGELLSTVRRDIQLNIVPCNPFVEVNMESDEVASNGSFVFNSCKDQTIDFTNLSTELVNIDDFIWIFETGIELDTFYEWNPTVYFEEAGTHFGQLILNSNNTCSDTANIIVNIVTEIIADFTTEYDTCISGPMQFTSVSSTIGSSIEWWEWKFGDNNFSVDEAPLHFYETPGLFQVKLNVIDEFNCQDSVEKAIEWLPAPEIIFISPDLSIGCAPLTVLFNNISWPIDSTYDIEWNFGDGKGFSYEISPTYTFQDTGIYGINISIVSPLGCMIDTTILGLIEVDSRPQANFSFFPENPSNLNPDIKLIDLSQRAVSWSWNFNHIDSSLIREPTYTFPDTGIHEIQLIVSDIFNCSDTLNRLIDVLPEVTYFLPNTFTPNGDGINDEFKGKGMLTGLNNFKMEIWNRWGIKIFETKNPNDSWTGAFQNKGKILPNGSYVFIVSYITPRGVLRKKEGVVILNK